LNPSCLIIAGEKSGEEHALSFFNELKSKNPNLDFFGVGGDELKNKGMELLYHLNDFSSWGYSEVLAKIPFYKKAMQNILDEVIKRKCKVAILIDFQSFNLKLAGKLKEIGVEVLYYVAPQAWAWKEYRVKKLSKSVNTLFTIIPFEKKWFTDRGVKNVISIEHPQLTHHKLELNKFKRHDFNDQKLKIVLLPGSRNFEVKELLEDFKEAILILRKEINIEVSIVKSSSVDARFYLAYESYFDKVYTNDQLVEALENADMAFAASGTVTLSCALFELPTIVCYRGSLLNYFIFETLVNYKGPISLANIVHNCSVFPELIQDKVSGFNIASIVKIWYHKKDDFLKMRKELQLTKELVKGEDVNIPEYISSVINNSYGKK
jgi:lipid-A-disaccharide synthase